MKRRRRTKGPGNPEDNGVFCWYFDNKVYFLKIDMYHVFIINNNAHACVHLYCLRPVFTVSRHMHVMTLYFCYTHLLYSLSTHLVTKLYKIMPQKTAKKKSC